MWRWAPVMLDAGSATLDVVASTAWTRSEAMSARGSMTATMVMIMKLMITCIV